MDSTIQVGSLYPAALLDWAGHHSGGVRRLFDENSGRPNKDILKTNLLFRLEAWAKDIAGAKAGIPRILLLVGGPGNGKTEAIELTINSLDKELGCNGELVDELVQHFTPPLGNAVPRIVNIDTSKITAQKGGFELGVVQDASVTSGHEGKSAAELLVEELVNSCDAPASKIYLCCVNRGVLDDALIHALDNNLDVPIRLLSAITGAVSLAPDAPSCWPLEKYEAIAVWPMDAESLLVQPDEGVQPPAARLLAQATAEHMWPPHGACAAGKNCPFCYSRFLLSHIEPRESLLRTLRWCELASGKRWSFRDLFSLMSYLLAGHHQSSQGQQTDPCGWAANLLKLDESSKTTKRPVRQQLTAIFNLATSSYQHALFHLWDSGVANSLRQDIKELGLDTSDADMRVLRGLQYFLQERASPYLPATIASLMEDLAELLDPALANPDSEVAVSGRSSVVLRDLDIRFSRSIESGIDFIRKYQTLSANELELLRRLAKADSLLSSPLIRRKKPTAASRIQRMLRDFSCRLVRRSICTRSAIVADADILKAFQQVVEDKQEKRLYEVAQQVKTLLNSRHGFEASLTTTFGQPLPPRQRQATLLVQPQPVRPLPLSTKGRPHSPICFLEVGRGQSSQPIALTYDLFKAVQELERGLSPASLPQTVVALIDTTNSRLAGPIVRDQDILADARIRIGDDGTEIVKSWNGFVSLKGRSNE
ncbi:hypothetical protein LY622_17700 [Halomonas sp. M5N1S17]|uniref:hypothetical protein n=1 Tax=Halomonas alkalisoli TaxID=2907158 RepID=UPI001F3BCD23|nr:hypothetical protein [Halomonas alkalisoli]MCE9665265.1 hypothetical protein [Halomonas alkalisoli]